jgi:hypothetical protein
MRGPHCNGRIALHAVTVDQCPSCRCSPRSLPQSFALQPHCSTPLGAMCSAVPSLQRNPQSLHSSSRCSHPVQSPVSGAEDWLDLA